MALVSTRATRAAVMSLTLALALAAPSIAQRDQKAPEKGTESQDSDEPVVNLGPGITPPRVIKQVNPDFDSGARGYRVTGIVLIGLIVSSQGLPREVHVVRSLDKDLDQSAVEAVRQWRFDPARKASNPVAVRVTVEIRFQDL